MDFTRDYGKQSLSEIAVSYIKNKILSGEFKSGDKLLECDISEKLEISRAPVREALRQLSTQGLVVFSPRKGNFVIELSLDEIMEVFDIRISLEVQVVSSLVQNNMLTNNDFTFLREMVENMKKQSKIKLDDHEKIFRLNSMDLEFHRYLWNTSKSFLRGRILEGLFYQLLIAMNHDVITLGTFNEKAEEHERIVLALEKNDIELATSQFKLHLVNYVKAVTQSTILP